MKMKHVSPTLKNITYIILVTLAITSCADVTHISDCVTDSPYGFFSGLWHGLIVPFSFIGSVFSKKNSYVCNKQQWSLV